MRHRRIRIYHGSLPKMLGGRPKKSKLHFDASLAKTGDKYLLAKFLMAKTYAVQVQDRALFERTLRAVVDAPEDAPEKMALANAVARIKAARLLKRIDELF